MNRISKIKLQEKGRKTSKKAKNSKRKKNETIVNLDPKESARSPNCLHLPEITKMNTSSHFRGHLKYMSIYVNQTIDEALLKPSGHQNHYLKPSKNLPQKNQTPRVHHIMMIIMMIIKMRSKLLSRKRMALQSTCSPPCKKSFRRPQLTGSD